MGKHEFLPLKMVIERGKLVPAEPYDAERLDTWRNGTRVNVTFVRDGGRVMERKWFAILNRAVKECKTPWKTSAEASGAIKLAIGVVNLTKTVKGDFLAYPKSLTDLTDPELDDAVQLMIDVVHRITGVDPAEWRRQVEHIRDEEPPASSPGDDGSGGEPSRPAAIPSGDEPVPEEGEHPGQVTTEQAAPSSALDPVKRMLMEECADNMLRDAFSDPKEQQPAKVEKLRSIFLEKQNLGDYPAFVNRCADTVLKIIGRPGEKDRAREYLMSKVPS